MNEETGRMNLSTGSRFPSVYVAYYFSIIVMLAAAFYPEYRVWGFNHWGYYQWYIPVVLFVVGAALPVVIRLLKPIGAHEPEDPSTGHPGGVKFLLISALLLVVFLVSFYFLRAGTHVLGDGYGLLGNIATVNPWIKIRNLGEELVHKLVYLWLSGPESTRTLLTFQLVSYASGAILLMSVAFAAMRLFDRLTERLLLFLGLTSSGYMLLYFGYVENYSVFVTSVMIYGLMALLVLHGKLNRWLILIPLVIAIIMHVFGVVLIPSAFYLLVGGTRLSEAITRLSMRDKIAVTALLVIAGAIVFTYFYLGSYFFRFALVPLAHNRFTVENYTLFSFAHIADVINLCFLLLPSLPVFLAVALYAPRYELLKQRQTVFLLTLTISTFGTLVIFDPKLGMPRDWDLFAFAGVPAALLGYYTTLKNRLLGDLTSPVVILAVFLGFSVLLPRAAGRARGDIELAHARNYLRHDIKKNQNVAWLIRDQLIQRDEAETANAWYADWMKNFPERAINQQGLEFNRAGRYAEAIPYFQAAIRENPMHAPTYGILGITFLRLQNYDSALTNLRIADGMSPNSVPILNGLAQFYRQQGNWDTAENYFLQALSIEGNNLESCLGLLELYWSSEQTGKHVSLLEEVVSLPEAPAVIHKRLGDHYLSIDSTDLAREQYRIAVDKGLDSTLLPPVATGSGEPGE
ncbi:MAG: tetratricopeptide repeat protein [Candidatus Zixiibacteriota bacterium]|nr:MAG: tetratricopeptide repeat protein [candidate division Zixibacteria bacterium]